MDFYKIYDTIEVAKVTEDPNALVDIIPFETTRAVQTEMHQHSFHELIWIQEGRGMNKIDNSVYDILPNSFFIIARGQVHSFEVGSRMVGCVIRFKDGAIPSLDEEKWDYRLLLFNHSLLNSQILISPETADEFKMLITQLKIEYKKSGGFGQREVVSSLLRALLIKLEQKKRKSLKASFPKNSSQNALLEQFLLALEENFQRLHSVRSYAELLNVHPRVLSDLIEKTFSQSAKKFIEDQIMTEAIRLLEFTPLDVKEIAYKLGYKSPFHFSTSFKKVKEIPPFEYRKKYVGDQEV